MKFPLSALEWLLYTSSAYFIAGVINLFVYRFSSSEYIQLTWILIMTLPMFVPMRKIVQIRPFWS